MKLIIFLMIFISCQEQLSKKTVKESTVDNKYCMDSCLEHSFKMFHNNGESWGTGSSSMNGLSQEKIFDRVERYCKEFMKNETCCKDKFNHHKTQSYQFGDEYYYGICKK